MGSVLLYGLHALGLAMHFAPSALPGRRDRGRVLFGIGAAISGYFPGTEMLAPRRGQARRAFAIPGGLLGAAAWTLLYQTPSVVVGRRSQLRRSGGHRRHRHRPPGPDADDRGRLRGALPDAALLLPRYTGGKRSYLRDLATTTQDEHDRAFARDTAAYLSEGSVDPLRTGRESRFDRLTDVEVSSANLHSRTIRLVGVLVAAVVVASLFLRQAFGQSTTYSWVVGHLFAPNFDYSREVFAAIGWEPLTDLWRDLRAMLSSIFISRRFTAFRPRSHRRGEVGSAHPGKRAAGCFVGSFLVLFGARMAGGCTSGHTLSGGVQLSLSAWFFTAAMLAALFLTARLVYRDALWRVRDV